MEYNSSSREAPPSSKGGQDKTLLHTGQMKFNIRHTIQIPAHSRSPTEPLSHSYPLPTRQSSMMQQPAMFCALLDSAITNSLWGPPQPKPPHCGEFPLARGDFRDRITPTLSSEEVNDGTSQYWY
ncbi:hypothetical protein VTN02DRAFT_3872 [Thermoascus thermophilus]